MVVNQTPARGRMHAEQRLACAEQFAGSTLSDLRGDWCPVESDFCAIPVTKPRRMPELKILEKESNLEKMNEIKTW